MPSSPKNSWRAARRRRLASLAAGAAVVVATAGGMATGASTAYAADQAAPTSSPSPGTATAVAGKVDLDVQLLNGVLAPLHLGLPDAIDLPLANLELGSASAPNANGDSANFTNSTLRLRDNLIDMLHLPGPEADLLKADVVSGTARVIAGPGGYTQAYATVTNLRLFLPLLQLPGASADDGILKVDAVSAQATCQPGKKPTASAKMPTTIVLLGKRIPVPLSGDVKLPVPGIAQLEVKLAPETTTDTSGASASVQAQVTINALNLATVSGGITLASAACTMPAAAAAGSGTPTGSAGGSSSGGSTSVGGTTTTSAPSTSTTGSAAATTTNSAAPTANGGNSLAHTGASGSLLPIAGIAVVLVLGGAGLLFYLRRKAGGLTQDGGSPGNTAPPHDE